MFLFFQNLENNKIPGTKSTGALVLSAAVRCRAFGVEIIMIRNTINTPSCVWTLDTYGFLLFFMIHTQMQRPTSKQRQIHKYLRENYDYTLMLSDDAAVLLLLLWTDAY